MRKTCHETFGRLIKQTETRCKMLSLKPNLEEACNQFAIRTRLLKAVSAHGELTLIRKFFREHVQILPRSVMWDTPIDLPQWALKESPEHVYYAEGSFSLPVSEQHVHGERILELYKSKARDLGNTMDDRSLAIELTRYTPRKNNRVTLYRKNLQPIEKSSLDIIDELFPNHSPLLVFFDGRYKVASYKTLLRIFPRVIWLTGMRPIELWTSHLYLPVRDKTFGPEDLHLAYSDPIQSIISKRHVLVHHQPYENMEDCMSHIRFVVENRLPVIVGIKSAKQNIVGPALREERRIQVLRNLTVWDLEALFGATLLLRTNTKAIQWDRINSTLNKRLRGIMEERFPEHRSLKTLYAFRHDFATRAKKCYLRHEVAALMGHTSKESLSCYGKKWSKKSLGGQNEFLPCPDPARSDMIREHWKSKSLTAKPVNDHEPECESCDLDDFSPSL